MEVLNDLFDYSLKIFQNSDYFKFSLDSILLGEFVEIKNNNIVLDLCSGNAPVPLILSTKNNTIKIDAVEVQKELCTLARKSIDTNNLNEQIRIFEEDIKNFHPKIKYDIVTCNPPYFKNTQFSQKNENKIKQIARHEILITLEQIISLSRKFLKENGSIYLVQRIDRLLETINLLEKNKFGIRKVVFVNTKENCNSEFFLIKATISKKSDLKVKTINAYTLKSYKNIFEEE